MLSALARHRSDGRYVLTLELATHKFRADGLGSEHEVPMNDWVPVGAVDADGNAVVLEPRKIDGAHSTVTLVADRLPARAGIDPVNELIDRIPEDNVMAVTVAP